MRRRSGLAALVAVTGPGLLAGLSDDDPAGITTYSILGADYGYQLLWVLTLSTAALVLFHELGARMGVVTGQGMAGLIRERYGVRLATPALLALVVANLGTTCAEFAGVAISLELLGVSRYVSVPLAALVVSALVLKGGFHRVERVLLVLATAFAAYIAAGVLAGPDWGAAARGLLVPSLSLDRDSILMITAVVGTTLAPWGLSFIQSYAVDKRLTPDDLRYERVDVVTGAVMTGTSVRSSWSHAPPRCTPRAARSPMPATRRRRSSRSPANSPQCSSARACSVPHCSRPPCCPSQPPTPSARRSAARHRWTIRSATRGSSTGPMVPSSRSPRCLC